MGLRRRELLLLGGSLVCARGLGCGGSPEPIVLAKEIPAGNASSLGAGTLTPVSGASVALGRDSGGIYGMSLVCTHQGCDIATSGGLVTFSIVHCGCHGSEFDNQGRVTLGPASRPLPHLLVTANAANDLTIHGDTVVPATDRLVV